MMAETESMRRRIVELESLLARKGCAGCCEVPDELRILQAENSHFRDLTHARLAEVEYWKKMYTAERQNYNDKLESLRGEFEDKFNLELQRLRKSMADTQSVELEYKTTIESKKREWEAKFAAALRSELSRLKQNHEDELKRMAAQVHSGSPEVDALTARVAQYMKEMSQLKASKDSLETDLQSTVQKTEAELRTRVAQLEAELRTKVGQLDAENRARVGQLEAENRTKVGQLESELKAREQQLVEMERFYSERERLLKEKLRDAIKEEAEKILARDYQNMVAMSEEISGLKEQLKKLGEDTNTQDEQKLVDTINRLREKDAEHQREKEELLTKIKAATFTSVNEEVNKIKQAANQAIGSLEQENRRLAEELSKVRRERDEMAAFKGMVQNLTRMRPQDGGSQPVVQQGGFPTSSQVQAFISPPPQPLQREIMSAIPQFTQDFEHRTSKSQYVPDYDSRSRQADSLLRKIHDLQELSKL